MRESYIPKDVVRGRGLSCSDGVCYEEEFAVGLWPKSPQTGRWPYSQGTALWLLTCVEELIALLARIGSLVYLHFEEECRLGLWSTSSLNVR